MTHSINWKLLALIPLSIILAGCSGIISKYGMNSFKRFEVSKDGHYLIPATMSASGPYSGINFEGVATFLVFLGYRQGKFEPTCSFITEAGSIEPPHYTWWPRKIVEKESSLYIEAYQSPRDTVKPFWFEIFRKGETETGLENFTKSKRVLRKPINENEMLIKD